MNYMKTNLLKYTGVTLITIGFLFIIVDSSLKINDPNEAFSRDIFGFPIPQPPLWASYIPYLNYFIGSIFEIFSLHGAVGTVILILFFGIGGILLFASTNLEQAEIKRKQRAAQEKRQNPS